MKNSPIMTNFKFKTRSSNRVYPPQKCKKPDCGVIFTPTDKRQQYCNPQHRIDHNNDLRTIKEQPFKMYKKKLAHNLALLKKIHSSLAANAQSTFSIQLLQYELYNFGIYTDKNINQETDKEIEWNYNYGIEVNDADKKTFIIHFRKTTLL